MCRTVQPHGSVPKPPTILTEEPLGTVDDGLVAGRSAPPFEESGELDARILARARDSRAGSEEGWDRSRSPATTTATMNW